VRTTLVEIGTTTGGRSVVSQKAIKHGYKSCEIKTINAKHFDELVRAIVLNYLRDESIE